MWVARDANHKVRGVQKNKKGPLRRDRVREEELERKRDWCKSHMCAGPPVSSSSACRSPAALTTIPAWGCLTTRRSQGPSRFLFFRSISISPFQNKHSPAYLTGIFFSLGLGLFRDQPNQVRFPLPAGLTRGLTSPARGSHTTGCG